MKINYALAQKVLNAVDCGLVKGVGVAEPFPHGDELTCVGSALREFKIKFNNSAWSSDKARAAGMRRLAVAQLGSDTLDQKEFSKKLAYKICTILLPDFLSQIDAYGYKENIAALKSAKTLEEAKLAARAAARADDAYAAAAVSAAAYADADDATYVSAAVSAVAVAYAAAAAAAGANAVANAVYADSAVAAYAAYATATAVAYAVRFDKTDKYLIMGADLCLSVLEEMSSPGCQFLHLCD